MKNRQMIVWISKRFLYNILIIIYICVTLTYNIYLCVPDTYTELYCVRHIHNDRDVLSLVYGIINMQKFSVVLNTS